MSDFVDRLLARNRVGDGSNSTPVGPLQPIRPRPVSRFEPAGDASWTGKAGVLDEAGSALPSLSLPTSAADSSPIAPAASLRLFPGDPTYPAQATLSSAEPIVPRSILADRNAPFSAAPTRARTGDEAGEPIFPSNPPTLSVESERQPEANPERPGEAGPTPVMVRLETVTPVIALPPEQPASPAIVANRPAEASTPLVRVTIGRIEVIAPAPAPLPPPVPRHKPSPVRPVRTLDDYLRRRNEERR
ncbi:MAG: hypothetical protein KDI79_13510 [Anaerolineae bacterium]|nr:hypothetical protein [Anaerolineae bacterium]